jgi:hypothetical protein
MIRPRRQRGEYVARTMLAVHGSQSIANDEKALHGRAWSATNQAVFVDGVPPEEVLPLHEGVVVTIVPQPRNATGDEPWRTTIRAFRDDALFQEYSDALKARRHEVADLYSTPHPPAARIEGRRANRGDRISAWRGGLDLQCKRLHEGARARSRSG